MRRITKTLIATMCVLQSALPVHAEKIYTWIGNIDENGNPLYLYKPLEKARLLIKDNDIYIEDDSEAQSLCYLPGEYNPDEFPTKEEAEQNTMYFHENIAYNNIHIPGENNISSGNVTISGTGNVSIGNTYIGGENNTSKNNTYVQGDNNTYIGNTHVAGSNNEATGNTYFGKSNQTEIGETTVGADNKDSHNEVYGMPKEPKKVSPSHYAKHPSSGNSSVPILLGFFALLVFVIIKRKNQVKQSPPTTKAPDRTKEPSINPTAISTIKKQETLCLQKTYFCPKCNGELRIIRGRNSVFWGCSNYPKCTSTYDDMDGKPQFENSTSVTYPHLPSVPPLPPKRPVTKHKPKTAHGVNLKEGEVLTHMPVVELPDKENRVWIDVTFDRSSKKYSYLLGDTEDLHIGDFVEVVAHDKYDNNKLKAKTTRVEYISYPGEYSYWAKSPILGKADSAIVALENEKIFHYAWCKDVKKDENIVTFDSEDDARRSGCSPCAKCHKW